MDVGSLPLGCTVEPTHDDVAEIIPDLPFSEEEWYQAYKRLYPVAEARDYARRLVELPKRLRAEVREGLTADPQHSIPVLHIDHDVLVVLATVSADLERRVGAYMEARFAEAATNHQHGLLLRRGLSKDADPPDDVRAAVRAFHAALTREWTERLSLARQRGKARP